MISSPAKRCLLVIAGTISLALGFLGIFLPLLPTTPFILLSCYCYMKSSERLYNWIVNHRVFGEYIYNYLTYRAIRQQARIGALLFLWVTLLISIFSISNVHVKILLFAVGIGVTIHLFALKTMKEETRAQVLSRGHKGSMKKMHGIPDK